MNAPAKIVLYLVLAFVGVFAAVTFFRVMHHGEGHDEWSLFDVRAVRDPEPSITEVRALDSFDSIDMQSAADFEITIGTPQKVSIEAGSAFIKQIVTEVQDGTLVIRFADDVGRHHHLKVTGGNNAHFMITVPSLTALHVEGAGHFEVHRLAGEKFDFHSEGASDLVADGEVDTLKLQIEGASHADTRAVYAKSVKVEVDGVGVADVRASDSLEATINGIGKIGYIGNPAIVKKDSSGFGSIKRED